MRCVDVHYLGSSRGFACVRNLFFNRARENIRFTRFYEKLSDLSWILLAAARGVNIQAKIAASVK